MSLKIDIKILAEKASKKSKNWVFANKILYDLCESYPGHKDPHCIVAKVWLIGRAYAAAIERRQTKDGLDSDKFYYNVVAPKILDIGKDLDKRINKIKTDKDFSVIDEKNLPYILETHKKLLDCFSGISKLEKRSLASKYLHFHCPNSFYIYDSRANAKIRQYINKDKDTPILLIDVDYDKEYKEFCLRMLELQRAIKQESHKNPTPRDLDRLLLDNYGEQE